MHQQTHLMDNITNREKEIIKLVALEKSNNEIATDLNISVNTVLTHKQNLFRKLQVSNSVGLALKSLMAGLIDKKIMDEYYQIKLSI